MNKIIAFTSIEQLEEFFKEKLFPIEGYVNIFEGKNGTLIVDNLLKYKQMGRDIIELLARYENLYFLKKSKPQPLSDAHSRALTAVYSCFHNLRPDNKEAVLQVLIKSFSALGFNMKLKGSKAEPDFLKDKLLDALRITNKTLLKDLIEQGADINARDNNNISILMNAIIRCDEQLFLYSIAFRNQDISALRGMGHVTSLEEQWQNLNRSLNEAEEMVKMIIEAGANIEDSDQNGDTILMNAIKLGYTDTVKMLLERGVNFEAQNNEGKTALMTAVIHKKPDIVKLLLDAGANTEVLDNEGCPAMVYALAEPIPITQNELVQLINNARTARNR
ncbi:MAG: ankyrin repeat domain-containing protein [Candidatus Margulisbacteria bacterium]|nr:ankyrin repeat domain-containing protein [Candidatus Margulisiibacteriota bacterium]